MAVSDGNKKGTHGNNINKNRTSNKVKMFLGRNLLCVYALHLVVKTVKTAARLTKLKQRVRVEDILGRHLLLGCEHFTQFQRGLTMTVFNRLQPHFILFLFHL